MRNVQQSNRIFFKRLRDAYRRESFHPTLLSVLISPVYFVRKELKAEIAINSHFMSGRLLDFGCGNQPYRHLFPADAYVGLDIVDSGHAPSDKRADVWYDGETIPYDDGHFDAVFASEVLEHVFNPDRILSELNRVLKPGGHLLVTLPFAWEEHEAPFDYARYTSFGLKSLLTRHGFAIVHAGKCGNVVETVVQLWNNYVYNHILPRNLYLKLLLMPLVVAPFTMAGIVLSNLLPVHNTLYLSNVFVAKKAG